MPLTSPSVETETEVVNMALSLIGSKRLTALATDNTVEAIQARLHYYQTRDALLRGHVWPFSIKRKTLIAETATPDSEFDYKYRLPSDFLRFKEGYELDETSRKPYVIEGDFILTDEDDVHIVYVWQVTDVKLFDPLFIEILVYTLAIKLLHPLAGAGDQALKMRSGLVSELELLRKRYRTLTRQESTDSGASDWNNSRQTT